MATAHTGDRRRSRRRPGRRSTGHDSAAPGRIVSPRPRWLLGPAFVAAIAYVDPGNVAANLSAGADHGYLLLWVLVLANGSAVIVQYLAAKLGIVTGRSLPDLLGTRLSDRHRFAYWAQAEIVAAATDLAEVIGGAIALRILFGLPLLAGGVIVGIVSMSLLAVQSRRGQRPFEFVIIGLLCIITIGFIAGLAVSPVDWGDAATGLIPGFDGSTSVLLATSMLGATVMPHAIYLHSSLARDHRGTVGNPRRIPRLLRATKWDVTLSLVIAGSVNVGMLLLAAASLPSGADTIIEAHTAIQHAFGSVIAIAFAVGLLASGLASTSVGCYAGSEIMVGLIRRRIPLLARRGITLIPALAILAAGVDPTWALVLSQVLLSVGIPFALIPLVSLTARRSVMGPFAARPCLRVIGSLVAAAIIALNLALVAVMAIG